MTQVDRAFLDIYSVERTPTETSAADALQYWRSQDGRCCEDDGFLLEDRLVSGWWLLPSACIGLGIWGSIFSYLV